MTATRNVDAAAVAAAAGRVGVLMGGAAAEREISLRSGAAVTRALVAAGIDATAIDWDGTVPDLFGAGTFDRYFNALHGRGGEDGQVQAVLDLHGLPYTGSGVLGCALAMDKVRSKFAWLGAGLPTPDFEIVGQGSDPDGLADRLGLPLMIKPAREGSSFGISKVEYADDIAGAVELARSFDELILAERFVDGSEYTLSILDGRALPMIRLETAREFYDFEAKYEADDTQYICPCGLPAEVEEEVARTALRAFSVLDGRGWGRVDFMCDADGRFWLIELNTVPGMTDHSLVPMAAAAAGISFAQLVVTILAASMPPEVLQ